MKMSCRIAAVATACAAAVALSGCTRPFGDSLDRERYIRDNVAVLEELPAVPGALMLGTSSSECLARDTADTQVGGYWTTRVFALPRTVSATRAIALYGSELTKDGWRLVHESAALAISARRGDAYVHVVAADDEVAVGVDHDWKHCPGP
jgi:hypothetical protein